MQDDIEGVADIADVEPVLYVLSSSLDHDFLPLLEQRDRLWNEF